MPILADLVADGLELRLIGFFHRLHCRISLAPGNHIQIVESIPRARSGRRPDHFNANLRQSRVHIRPEFRRLLLPERLGCKGGINLAQREIERNGLFALRQNQPIHAHLDLDHILRTIFLAIRKLAFLHSAGRIHNIGKARAKPGAKQLDPAASSRRFHNRRQKFRIVAAEILRHRRGERKHGGRPDNADLRARIRTAHQHRYPGKCQNQHRSCATRPHQHVRKSSAIQPGTPRIRCHQIIIRPLRRPRLGFCYT